MPVFKARHKVIRIADKSAASLLLGSHYALKPQVQDIVQINICRNWRNHSALRSARLRMDDSPILFQDTRSQPLANQIQEGSVINPLLQHLFQPIPPDVVKGTHDTLPTPTNYLAKFV